MRLVWLVLELALPAPASAQTCMHPPRVVMGMDSRGVPTAEWIEAIRDRVEPSELASVAARARPVTASEGAWAALVGQVAPLWCVQIERLNAPFHHVPPPADPEILLGNQGGGDGFTSGSDAIAFDLDAIATARGQPDPAVSPAFLQRLLSHEYTHLLLHRVLDASEWTEARVSHDPFLQALRVLYNEGIANLRSIEGDPVWVSSDGHLTDFARQTLAELQPRMIDRLRTLAEHPPPEAASQLLRNISQGPLAKKWGAIPIALWLAESTRFDAGKLARWIEAGPRGILGLAVREADPGFRSAFRKLLHLARNRTLGGG